MNGRLLAALGLGVVIAALAAWLLLGPRGGAGGPEPAADNPCDAFPSLDGALTGWMREWRALEPALTCEHFARSSDATPPVRVAAPWSDADGLQSRAPARWRSPDGSRLAVPSHGRGAVAELALVDVAAGTRRLLLRDESGGGWRDAGWMDERSLVAAGEAPGAAPGTVVPTLTLIRLDSNRVSVFEGPAVPAMRLQELGRPPVP